MSTFKIFPIYLGKFKEWDLSTQIAMRYGDRRPVYYGCLVLKNNQTGEITLLDTGYASKEEVEKYDLPYKYIFTGERVYSLEEELAGAGFKPSDVTRIGLTHLHQDHCWNLQLFPKDIPIYVQKKELQRAVSPRPIERKSYSMIPYEGCPAWMRGIHQFKLIDGDYEIEPGLRAVFTPGHTPGSQSFLIDTEKGQYIYTGDLHMCAENHEEDAMIGWYNSMDDWYESNTKVKAFGAVILGAHCKETYEQKCFG